MTGHGGCRRCDAHRSGSACRRLLQFEQGKSPVEHQQCSRSGYPTEKGVIIMPPKAFNQNMNAADGMLALESQGYIVQIKNGGSDTSQSKLSAFKITDVDGLQGSNPPPSTTVHLTPSCPNSNN
jgi:hypothetical protein